MLNFDPALIGDYFQWGDALVTFPQFVPIQIIVADMSRVYLLMQIENGSINMRPGSWSTDGRGINAQTNQINPVILEFSKVGSLCGTEWWGMASSPGVQAYVLWVRFKPKGDQ